MIYVFRLLDRQETDSYQENDPTKKLDFASNYVVKNPFFIREKGGEKILYRYCPGAKSLLMAQQIIDKEVFNPIEDAIVFKNGEDILVDDEFDKNLVDILLMHPTNTKSKFHIPGVNTACFETYNAVEEAQKEVSQIDKEDEAMGIVIPLKDNPKKLKQMAYIFGVPADMADEQIYLALRAKAKEAPELFISSIASGKNSIMSNVRKAFDYTLITWDAKGCIFTKEGGLILEAPSKNKTVNEEKLIDFLMSEEGKEFYNQILSLIEHAELDLNKAKT